VPNGKPEIVGRDDELAALSTFFDQPAVALLIDGEAGIGKTTIWQAGMKAARERGYRILACTASSSEAQLAYAGLGDLFDGMLDEVLDELPGPQSHALRVALLLEQPERATTAPRAVFVSTLGALRALARSGPVLVSVDDLQWLDSSSVSALEFVARRLPGEPVRLLLARRRDGEHRVERAVGEDRLCCLELQGLSLGALHRLLADRLETSLARPLVRRIHEIAAGNPFYALELGRGIVRRDKTFAPGDPLPVPERLHDLVGQRVAALPNSTRKSLLAAAALAHPTLGVAGLDRATLAPALDASVVTLEDKQVRFTHPLLSAVLYAEAEEDERRELHRALADAASEPEERARHLALGVEDPDEEVARAVELGAERAAARGAPTAAAELLELAAARTPDPDLAAGRLLKAAWCHLRGGDFRRVRTLAERLCTELDAGPERASALFLVANDSVEHTAAIEIAEEALVEADGDPSLQAQLHLQLASFRLFSGGVRDALGHARAAVLLSSRADPRVRAETLAQSLRIEGLAGEPIDQNVAREALALEDWTGPPLLFAPSRLAGIGLIFQGRLDEARELLHACLEHAVAHGDELVQAMVLDFLTTLEVRAGNLGEADRLTTAYSELSEADDWRDQYGRALVAASRGRVEEARAAASKGAALAGRVDELSRILNVALLGSLELSLGDFEAAAELLVPLAEWLEEIGWGEPAWPAVLPDAIEALVGCGEVGRAGEFVLRLEERAQRIESPWVVAAARYCRGLLLLAEGNADAAVESFGAALAVHELIQCPIERARVLSSLGVAERRQKKRRAARSALEQALETFERVGATLWADRARKELARIAGRRAHGGELTPTERRVAELVAKGSTNREVAQILVVAERTVEWNLSKVYRKLGVRSRTELARRFAEIR
jgi:DNA-binding CsgD family transcriptional regulator